MEITVEAAFQHVTWKIKDFSELPQEIDFYVDSPEFLFGGDSYCLRLFPRVKGRNDLDYTAFHLRRMTVTLPDRRVSYKIGFLKNVLHEMSSLEKNRFFLRELLLGGDDEDGILTMVCYMPLSEESREGSSGQGEEERFPGQHVPFSFRWNPPKMELLSESPCTQVELTVREFLELQREVVDEFLTSPEFRFAGDTYCFRFCPNGDTEDTDLQLVRLTSTYPERTVSYRVGYRDEDNEKHTYPHNSRSLVGKIGFCLSRSIIQEEREKYAPGGILSLVFFLRLGDWSNSRVGGIQKLQSDYRRLLQNGLESDACVVVRGKEFPVHRAVLRARSTVFEAMFGHDTAVKESGRVVMDDLDPDSFGHFLHYLYTGDVQDKLSDDNAFGLYVAADKYDVSTLKSECMEYMLRTLSVDSFCDVITLALRYSDENLKQQSFKFFRDNLKRIIRKAKWQQFMSAYSTFANELFTKAHEPATQ